MVVVGKDSFGIEVPFDAPAVLRADAVRRLKQDDIAAVAVARQEDLLAALGPLEHGDEAHETHGATGVADPAVHHVGDLDLVVQAHLLGEGGELPGVGRVEGEVRHVGRGEALFGQRRRYTRRDDVGKALVHREPVFSGAHERVAVRTPHVLDLVVLGIEAGDFGDDAARGDEERRGAVPEVHLAGSRGMPQTGIRR